jgi:lauroyl/myristoyl acyltransferase
MSEMRASAATATAAMTAPQAPERGWSWRLLGSFHVTGVFWYRFHRFGIRILPSVLVGGGITVFTTFFFFFLRKIRAAIAANLEPVLGPCGWFERQRRIYRTMWMFAWCNSERYERLSTKRRFVVETEALEIWDELARSPRGLVLVTAHIGNYDVGSVMPAQATGRCVHLVREPEADPRAQAFIREVVAEFSQHGYTMHFQADDPLQGLMLLGALQRGEIVAVQGDRPRTGSRSLAATLFGKPVSLPTGPAALARSADVPMLPVFVFREGRRRYRVVFRPPIVVPRTGNSASDLSTAVQRIASEVEWAIRREPFQWFCFGHLWPE